MIERFFIFLFLVVSSVTFAQNILGKNVLHFYVGTYTDSGSEGIYRFGLDVQSGKLHSNGFAVLSENPSYLAMSKDGRNLLAVRETKDESNQSMGYIELFKIDDAGNLTSVNKVASGGAHPCYVSVNEDGLVLASNYTEEMLP